jgi:hypothetical protein
MKKNPLFEMMKDSVLGALGGLVTGFVLGSLINLVSVLLYPNFSGVSGAQLLFPGAFLGMGFGTVIGGILGGFVAIKKMK